MTVSVSNHGFNPEGPKGMFPGANSALALLLLINLFNYVDRYVLAAVWGTLPAAGY